MVLADIADRANISEDDTVLEIGPGLGTLTSELLRRAKKVISVEYDSELARKLPGQFPGKNLEVVCQDFLTYDLDNLPVGYRVVANVPYYITSKIVHKLMTAKNKPSQVVLLVQKEVAERLASRGRMSILTISAQIYAQVELDTIVPAELFTPPPKVDSQVVILDVYEKSLIDGLSEKDFFRLVKAGFSMPRKKLSSSLSGGLGISKQEAIDKIVAAGIDYNLRAENLSIEDWKRLLLVVDK